MEEKIYDNAIKLESYSTDIKDALNSNLSEEELKNKLIEYLQRICYKKTNNGTNIGK